MLERRKKAVKNNCKSGCSREEVPFEEDLNEIGLADDSVKPEVLRIAKCVYLKQLLLESNLSDKDSNVTNVGENVNDFLPKKKYKLSFEERKLELFKQKEETKERRHQEKLQILRELFSKKESD